MPNNIIGKCKVTVLFKTFALRVSKFKVDDDIDVFIESKVEAELEFIEGSLDDFRAGRKIVVKYSEPGMKKVVSEIENEFSNSFREVFKQQSYQMISEFEDCEPSDIDVDLTLDAEKVANEKFVIDGDLIKVAAMGETRLKVKILVRY